MGGKTVFHKHVIIDTCSYGVGNLKKSFILSYKIMKINNSFALHGVFFLVEIIIL